MTSSIKLSNIRVFSLLWIVIFALYLPAAKAGFVLDFTGWLDQVKNHSFAEYINRTNFHVKSLYQFTQLVTYAFYLMFGSNAWLWHLLFVSLQALNGFLLWRFCSLLLQDSGVENGKFISLAGTLLFSTCPHISEVVVWEPSFHYLQGLLILLIILSCVQSFFRAQRSVYVWTVLIVYALSLFSLEYFYLTPVFVLLLTLYYRGTLKYDKKIAKQVLLYVILPFIILLVGRIILFRVLYHDWVSRIGSGTFNTAIHDYLVKPPKYFFHIVLLGRFFSFETRQKVYAFCESAKGLAVFYTPFLLICAYVLFRYRKLSNKAKATFFIFLFAILAIALVMPMDLPSIQLVVLDRYAYMLNAFVYMLMALLISYIPGKYTAISVIGIVGLINIRYTIQVNRYWMKGARIDNNLLYTYQPAEDKITILLNLPESMHGVPMMQATGEGEFKLMHNLLLPEKINGVVLDAASFNMEAPGNGAHVTVLNDSMVNITLNEWGTWWWYNGLGAVDRENEYYKAHFPDAHWYELTLRKPASQYRLLFQTGGVWKTVDWSKKNVEQY